MKVGLQTWGTDGDVRPFTALAGGLRKAGHDVTLGIASVDGKDYSALASALDFRVIHHRPPVLTDLGESARKIKSSTFPVRQIKLLADFHLAPYMDEMLDSALEMAKTCDLLIGHPFLAGTKAVAEKTGVGHASVFLCHAMLPSRHSPPHPAPNLGRFLNGVSWKIADALTTLVLAPIYNRLRKRLGLSSSKNVFQTGWKSKTLNLVAVSPQLARKMPDWDETTHVCGFFDVPVAAENWRRPEELEDFLNGGEPPMYMTFGSMTQFDPHAITEGLVKAALISGRRAIIQSNWDAVGSLPTSPKIYRISKVPHHEIFPECAMVVHHGGAGTTHSSAYCGAPSVVVAHAFDQAIWGKTLKKAGIGGRVLDMRTVTPEKLAVEMNVLYHSQSARDKAKLIGKSMRMENGVSRAVSLIESLFGK